jgi:hypothetical protein
MPVSCFTGLFLGSNKNRRIVYSYPKFVYIWRNVIKRNTNGTYLGMNLFWGDATNLLAARNGLG